MQIKVNLSTILLAVIAVCRILHDPGIIGKNMASRTIILEKTEPKFIFVDCYETWDHGGVTTIETCRLDTEERGMLLNFFKKKQNFFLYNDGEIKVLLLIKYSQIQEASAICKAKARNSDDDECQIRQSVCDKYINYDAEAIRTGKRKEYYTNATATIHGCFNECSSERFGLVDHNNDYLFKGSSRSVFHAFKV